MPRQPKRPSLQKQAGLTAAEQKRREKEFARELKAWEKDRAKWQRALDRQYERQLAALERMGIYEPKGKELTPYRKKRIRAAYREYSEYMTGDFQFVALPGPETIKQAKGLTFKTTKKGAFVPLEGHKKAKVTRKRGETYIDLTGKVKRGPSGGERRYKVERIPLRSLDIIANEKERLRQEAADLMPLSGKERLAFVLTINDHEGFSKKTYDNIEHLIEDVERYEKTVPWKVQDIFRHIRIVKVESDAKWREDHPRKNEIKKRRVNLKGRNV
jgi:hypothetical protein